jgi:hypothetical protein
MGVDQAWEKFSNEIRFALVSGASLQERLGCLISGVSHLQRDSFPDERTWDDFRKLVNEVTKREARYPADAPAAQMSDEKAREYLRAAFDIYSQITKAFGRTEFVI